MRSLQDVLPLCFAEAASLFTRNGGPYLYAKHALGDFWGFEVGVLKWIVTVIAWAAMARWLCHSIRCSSASLKVAILQRMSFPSY